MIKRKEVWHPTKLKMILLNMSNQAELKNTDVEEMVATLIVLFNTFSVCVESRSCLVWVQLFLFSIHNKLEI